MPSQLLRTDARVISITPTFKLAFVAGLVLTIISLLVAIYLSGIVEPTPQQVNLFDTCSTTWKMGFGVLIGLLGGKATS